MPQIDPIVVFNQVFWLLVILGAHCVYMVRYVIPSFMTVLKFRSKILRYSGVPAGKLWKLSKDPERYVARSAGLGVVYVLKNPLNNKMCKIKKY